MRLLTLSIALVFSVGVYAQNAEVKDAKTHDPQASQSVLQTEKILDEKITGLNDRLKNHTVLFRQKIKALPAKTVLTKGTADGDNCKEAANQEDPANNCIKLEVFDFQDSEWGKSDLGYGSRAKYMILFYNGPSTGTDDPKNEAPRELQRVLFVAKNINFKENETHYANISDSAPHTANGEMKSEKGGAHDEKMTIIYVNGFPVVDIEGSLKKEETVSEKGVGKYKLQSVENSKTNPIRNTFKKNFFVKNLDYFHKLFTNVADTNERYSLKKYKESNEYMKSSLKY